MLCYAKVRRTTEQAARPCHCYDRNNGPPVEFLRLEKKDLLDFDWNIQFFIVLRARAVSSGDSLEFPVERHGAGSKWQLREAEEVREAEV